MSKEQLKSLKIRTTQMCGCVPELLWMRALNPRKNTQFSPRAGCVTPFLGASMWLTSARAAETGEPTSACTAACSSKPGCGARS